MPIGFFSDALLVITDSLSHGLSKWGINRSYRKCDIFPTSFDKSNLYLEGRFLPHYWSTFQISYIFNIGTCWALKNWHCFTKRSHDLELDIHYGWGISKCTKSRTAPKQTPVHIWFLMFFQCTHNRLDFKQTFLKKLRTDFEIIALEYWLYVLKW